MDLTCVSLYRKIVAGERNGGSRRSEFFLYQDTFPSAADSVGA